MGKTKHKTSSKKPSETSSSNSSFGCLIILAILCLVVFLFAFGWIAGIIWLIFLRKKMEADPVKQKKYTMGVSAASAISFMFFIYSMVNAPSPLTSLALSTIVNKSELEINSDYAISLQYEPDDASLSNITYNIDNPLLASIQVDSDDPTSLILHTKKEGVINVTAQKEGIESNTLTFTIIDSSKIKSEETEKEDQADTESDFPADTKLEKEEPLGFNVAFARTYQNDVTGNWRLARIAENISIEEYALDYYKNYFEADSEIHIIINFTRNTTTRITVIGNLLDVATMEYVDKEEHDATLACSGKLLSEYHVDINTGEIEKITTEQDIMPEDEQPTTTANKETEQKKLDKDDSSEEIQQQSASNQAVEETEQQQAALTQDSSSQNNTNSFSSENNFDTYDNTTQQQTADTYVLNTSRMKIHYPKCSSVPKIAPQNYATSSDSLENLISQGYTTCGICFK